jgi:tetratricopeptide (TPR) repeat protein
MVRELKRTISGMLLCTCALLSAVLTARPAETLSAKPEGVAVIEVVQGKVEMRQSGGKDWLVAKTNAVLQAGDGIRTAVRSRALLRIAATGRQFVEIDEASMMQIKAGLEGKALPELLFDWGKFRWQSRLGQGELPFQTPVVACGAKGTEFHVLVEPGTGRTTVTMLDGEVEMTNAFGRETLRSGEEGVVEAGAKPIKRPVLNVVDVIQWSLYYPAVLATEDLPWGGSAPAELQPSLDAYRSGDLLAALDLHPTNRVTQTDAERVYWAALLLAVGQVDDAERELAQVDSAGAASPGVRALRHLMATVALRETKLEPPAATASEWLAESYQRQQRRKLEEALAAAREATRLQPGFGFAWARVAELEFGHGRTGAAREAARRAVECSPRHAPAVALLGFISAAQGRVKEAMGHFDQAIALDGAYPPAWLGRGLCQIRLNRLDAGRRDLQTAATLETHRGLYHSYLGKALSVNGDTRLAGLELEQAKRLDPADPTAWLYSALVAQEQNRVNVAVQDLEESKARNDNRALFRSRALLDQDRAVRGANLASVYTDAGMREYGLREAMEAVQSDYANASAHLFLADSYFALRDQQRFGLRYETPWHTEYVLGNLLAPVGGGNLSQTISESEYGRLFTREKLGVASRTEYTSNGDWVQAGTQHGFFGQTAYAADAYYQSLNGQRPNQNMEQLTLSLQAKQQVGAQDSLLVQGIYLESEYGDVAPYYNPEADSHKLLRGKEHQEPLVMAGWHHEWQPGSHTLMLVGHWDATGEMVDPENKRLVIGRDATGSLAAHKTPNSALQDYRLEYRGESAELQHMWQQERNALIVGGRYQRGEFEAANQMNRSGLFSLGGSLTQVAQVNQTHAADLERWGVYAYDQFRLAERVHLTAGVSYDRQDQPRNMWSPPISSGSVTVDQVSPKFGVVITPWTNATFSAAYTRSLGGVSLEQSLRLEPSQVGGVNQAYRGLMPESVTGIVPGQEMKGMGMTYDQKFATRTYLTAQVERWTSAGEQEIGVTEGTIGLANFRPGLLKQTLDLEERSLTLAVNQLLGECWSLGAAYRLAKDRLATRYPDYGALDGKFYSTLHQLTLQIRFQHQSGFFSQFQSVWNSQSNRGYTPDRPGDDFWHFNVHAGWRFWRRHAEVSVGVLNLTDQDYRLNPLNSYLEPARDRTLVVMGRFYF